MVMTLQTSCVCWCSLYGLILHSDVVRFTGPKGELHLMSVPFSPCGCQPVTNVTEACSGVATNCLGCLV